MIDETDETAVALAGIADAEAGRFTTIATREDGETWLERKMAKLRERLATTTKTSVGMQQAKRRPANYNDLSPREQWEIDKQLGILDWDGT
jgi:hypothetical protein